MSALAEFNRGFTLGWAGDTLDKGEPALVKSAYKAGRTARADHDYWLLRGESKQ